MFDGWYRFLPEVAKTIDKLRVNVGIHKEKDSCQIVQIPFGIDVSRN